MSTNSSKMNEQDIESANNAAAGAASERSRRASFAKEAFLRLLETIQEKRYRIDPDKRFVYRRLMDQLDAVEKRHQKWTIALITVEILVLSGWVAALVCSLKLERLNHQRVLELRLWQWFAMALMLTSGLTVVRSLTAVVLWPVNWWWRINKYVVYFTRRLKRCVDVMLWFCVVLLGWYVWFRPRLRHVYGDISRVVAHQVTRFFIALCIGSFLWLIKNALYLKLEGDLHYGQLFQRIQKTVAYLHGLQILHKRGMWKFLTDNKSKKKLVRMARKRCNNNNYQEIFTEVEEVEEPMKGVNIWMEVLAMEKKSVPIWIIRRLEEEYLDQIKLMSLPGNNDFTKDDQRMIKEAKKMFKQLIAKRIHDSHRGHFSDHEIMRQDVEDYGLSEMELDFIFKSKNKEEDDDDNESEVLATSSVSRRDRTIGREEFLKWAVKAYKNCWGLKRTVHSSKRVLIKLNRLLSVFLLTIMAMVWLLLSEIVNTGQLALLFSPFLATSFVFGDSCKKMFDGLLFAFAMHPFDVGDRVIINDTQMRVTELNILTSVFYKYDTGEEVITPNSTLTTTSIINLDITPDQSDKVEFVLCPHTPLEDIKDIEIKIKKMLDDDIEYSSKNKVVKSEIGKDEMKMTVYFKYLVSYLTAETKALHKSKILSIIMRFLKDMDMNKKEYSSSYKPYIVEISFRAVKVKLGDIEDLQAEIMRGLEKQYMANSKVVMMELTKSRIKMGLYMCISEEERVRGGEGEEDESIICPTGKSRDKWKAAYKKKDQIKNLGNISEGLKRKKIVKEVIIHHPYNNGDDEVISHGGIRWGSFQARDVIESHDNPSTSMENMNSGGVEEKR